MNSSIHRHPEVQSSIRLFQAWAETQMAYRGLPGASFGVVYDQELIWSTGVGYADIARNKRASEKTIYRIASITKLFTSTAIMQLRDAGRLGLDDPVVQHLPWFHMKEPDGAATDITIRQLLTHTSGLPREAAFPYWTDGEFPTREQLVDGLREQQPVFAPLTQWKYSNLALTLAGEVIAAVAEEPYADYIEREILKPLGMESTSVVLPEAHRERLATAYGRRLPDGSRSLRPFTDCRAITPAANMSSTVEDLARFASLQFRDGAAGGAQILKGSSLREMHRVHWLNPDWTSGWGLGFVVRRREDRTLIEHGGALPGYRTQVSICAEDKLAFIVLTNADDGDPAYYVEQAYAHIALAIKKASTREPTEVQWDPAWERYLGTYRNPWDDTSVLVTHEGLVLISPIAPDGLNKLLHLTPEGEHTFRISGDNGYANIGELAVFELGSDGKVVRLKIGANYTYPVKDEA